MRFPQPDSLFRRAIAPSALLFIVGGASAPAVPRLGAQPVEPSYSIPYRQPTVSDIADKLARLRDYLAASFASAPGPHPLDPIGIPGSGRPVFGQLDYTTGVIYTGLLQASAATGDASYRELVDRELRRLGTALSQAEQHPNSHAMRAALHPEALDDCGSMTAALIRARLAGAGPDLHRQIDRWADYISHRQFRLPDGTLARQRPQPISLWADDFYMGVEPLAELGHLTRQPAYFDDAVRDTLQTAQRLFRPARGLFAHGWSEDSPHAPEFYWGRANGWAMVTLCDLLDVLPTAHPRRAEILGLLRSQIRGVAALQSGEGRWHQLLDRPDSYLETSCTAMFVYGIAHAINRGWIEAPTFGPIAQAGWLGLAAQISDRGQVDQSCVGTTYAGDAMYYYHRPASVNAAHGYGPALLAGAEMIRLLRNPAVRIEFKNQAFHYVPVRE